MNESGWVSLIVSGIAIAVLASGALDQLLLIVIAVGWALFIGGVVLYLILEWTLGEKR